jgi:putative addiction module CopG family antidote
MAVATMNVSLTKRQAELINNEVEAGRYTSASEFIRERIREWDQRRIDQDVAALEHAHTGAWERDTTPEEESSILKAQQEARGMRLVSPRQLHHLPRPRSA